MSVHLARLLAKDPVEDLRPAVLGFAVVLFGASVALRFAFGDSADPILLFSLVPIAIIAIELGPEGGLAAAAAAVVATGMWSAVADVTLTPLAFVSRLTAFFLVGLLVGYLFERLQAAREAQRRLLESSLNAIVGLNLDGKVTSVNSRALALFGRRREEMVDQRIEQFLPDFFSHLGEKTFTGRPRDLVFRLPGRDGGGQHFSVDVNVTPWESEAGALLLSIASPVAPS